jgi:hypothetical protein
VEDDVGVRVVLAVEELVLVGVDVCVAVLLAVIEAVDVCVDDDV